MKLYKRLFDVDPWKISSRKLPEEMRLMESITSIGNGYMGMRGNFEEGYSGDSLKGSYIAGVWHPDKTRVGWWKNGYPLYFGKMINAVDFIKTEIMINGEKLDLAQNQFSDFCIELDMRNGLLSRSFVYHSKQCSVRILFQRFLSIVKSQLAFFNIEFELLSGTALIQLFPSLDGDVFNEDSNYGESFWMVENCAGKGEFAHIQMRTVPNDFGVPQFTVTAMMHNRLHNLENSHYKHEEKQVSQSFSLEMKAGEKANLQKTVAVITDRDYAVKEHEKYAATLLEEAREKDFEEHLKQQTEAWAKRWERADVLIEGDAEAQQGIRFNLFQLFCTYYGEDERLNIGPKGFTGEKYGGATYWDTEAYIFPMYLSLTKPEVPEKLLRYRYNQLDGAFHNARQQGLAGALFPMVTFNGVECHNEWEITFEEIHRNGAIAYAIYNYSNYTGDESYLLNEGIEVLVAISRFWADRVHFSQNKGKYMIHGVTGPNEYENNVNNNWYTNYLARWTLQYTLETLPKISSEKKSSLDLNDSELENWREIFQNIYFPEDKEKGIFVQHDTFLDKDLKSTDSLALSERPLNQHWSWDRILRSCFIKQADVLQGIYLFGDQFSKEEKRRNFDFYEPMTVHESSLSASIHAILAAELGKEEKAAELYARTARLDLDNYNNDTDDGLHITSMSGSWLAIVQGFAGMRTFGGKLSFAPFCPEKWEGYRFTVNYRGRRMRLYILPDLVQVELLEGDDISFELYEESVLLSKGEVLKRLVLSQK